jgi:hypothetical protein
MKRVAPPNETYPNSIYLVGDCVGIRVNFDDYKRRCHLKQTKETGVIARFLVFGWLRNIRKTGQNAPK